MVTQPCHHRRGVILPVMLLILILLGLLAASFAFRVHADYSAMNAVAYRMHTRLAAEAGIEKVLLMLRTQRTDVQAWYNNPEELNRIIVWTPQDDTLWGTNQELQEGGYAYRFSLVADAPFDDEERCRYGITDESAKLNINTATRRQIARLIGQIATREMVVEELVDALLDWRDADDTPGEFGAEARYYASLATPYRPKNGLFDTVEELLMVKGFDGRVLYGEDQDRNGLMTPNEDDGDESFPLDDGDGLLNRGLYPYITVFSRETPTDRENRPRVFLYGDPTVLGEQLAEFIEDPAKVQFIVSAVTGQGAGGGQQSGEDEGADEQEGVDDEASGEPDQERGGQERRPDRSEREGRDRAEVSEKSARRSQVRVQEDSEDEGESQQAGDDSVGEDEGSADDERGGEDQPGPATSQPAQLASPADLLTVVAGGANPLTIEDLPVLMERTTTQDPLLGTEGLINIMTAPPQVLRCLEGLTGEEISGIIAARGDLSDEERASSAWLVTREILSLEQYQQVVPQITVSGLQFTIESLGYADHIGTVTRLQVIVEMRGPMAQVLYYRDVTSLGAVYPIREGEEEYGFGGRRG